MPDALEIADAAYEAAEARFFAAVRRDGGREALCLAAEAVADAAAAWNTLAYARLHAAGGDERRGLDLLTERTEVLSDLWNDLARAYRQSQP